MRAVQALWVLVSLEGGAACRPSNSFSVLMISETSSGRLLFVDGAHGAYVGRQCVSEMFPVQCPSHPTNVDDQCLVFGVEHALETDADETHDRLMVAFNMRAPELDYTPAGVVAFRPGRPPRVEWAFSDLSFEQVQGFTASCNAASKKLDKTCYLDGTHVAVTGPDGQTILVGDTSNSRVLWVRPPDSVGANGFGTGEVLYVLDPTHPDWDGYRMVNHLQVIEQNGETWLLTTFKASESDSGHIRSEGRIVLWDITDPDDVHRLWAYPEEGVLAAVHSGRVIDVDGTELLVYAHSLGASESIEGPNGSVGIARFNGADPPVYLGDGVLPDGVAPFGYVREVDGIDGGHKLLVTDSGCENSRADCGLPSQVVEVDTPDLDPPGTAGAFTGDHAEQVFFDLNPVKLEFERDPVFPYESHLLESDELGVEMKNGVEGRCGEGSAGSGSAARGPIRSTPHG